MTSKRDSGFDFNAQAKALLKTISPTQGAAPNPALALAAVEAALREAFTRGKESAGAARGTPRPTPKPSPFPAKPELAKPAAPIECDHEWEEAFIDGRALGFRCIDCGILQRDVQERCNHYFVQSGGKQVCVACRKTQKK